MSEKKNNQIEDMPEHVSWRVRDAWNAIPPCSHQCRSRTAKYRAGAHGGLSVARATRCALPSSPFSFCAPALPPAP